MSRLAVLRHPLMLKLYLPALMLKFGTGLLVPVLPLYAAEFEIGYGLIGLILAGEALGTLLGDVPTGMLRRRMSDKHMMMLGAAITTFSTLALVVVQSIWVVFALRLISGFGTAMVGVSMHIYLAERVQLSKRGKAISIFGGVHRLGGFMGPAVGGAVAAAFGLRAPFVLFAVSGLMGLLLVWRFAHHPAKPKPQSEPQHPRVLAVLRDYRQILAFAGTGQIFGQMIRAGRTVIIPLFGAAVLGLSVDQIGFIVSASVLVDFGLFYVAGWVMDRYGRKFAIVPCFAIQGFAMALIPLTGSFAELLLVSLVIGLGNGLGSGTMMTLGADLSPDEARGEFLGVWRLMGDVGFTGGPLVVGGVAQVLMLQAAIWVIAGAGLAAAGLFLFFVPETLQRKAKPDQPAPLATSSD